MQKNFGEGSNLDSVLDGTYDAWPDKAIADTEPMPACTMREDEPTSTATEQLPETTPDQIRHPRHIGIYVRRGIIGGLGVLLAAPVTAGFGGISQGEGFGKNFRDILCVELAMMRLQGFIQEHDKCLPPSRPSDPTPTGIPKPTPTLTPTAQPHSILPETPHRATSTSRPTTPTAPRTTATLTPVAPILPSQKPRSSSPTHSFAPPTSVISPTHSPAPERITPTTSSTIITSITKGPYGN